ncbi:MAG TPA: asparagine synthase (glutamine-hydrolyzing) [Steroidobacteraceae bacterium]|nr:asparagine synthase (glutamine-hydrolyzing) [Steroidobacteraceae bacterium]
MCGIAGFVSFDGHPREEAAARVRHMTQMILHRGPDEEGFHVDDLAALGHRRLAIIDLSSGQQPMSALEGRLQIVFNGEIYNFLEVRAELEALGHRFHTRSDTEVILLAYAQWGERCVERLAGMFAFALWDCTERALLLARDRVGKKPLYYWLHRNGIAFASELKALRAGGLCPTAIDPESLDCYLTFGYIPAPRTIYAGVRKLPAAHTLRVSAAQAAPRRYWTLSFAEPRDRSLEQATEEFGALLDRAVQCRLMSEVPLGAFLSGGIDSSLVVSSMARLMDRPVITHTIGFEEREFSELPAAARIAQHLATDHHELIVTPRASDVIERISWHFDEPVADSSAVPTWYVCEMARRSVTVALSGDGGDEAFGGYTFRYLPHVLESRIRHALAPALRSTLFGPLGAAWPASALLPRPLRLKTILENLAVGDAQAFYRDLAWLRPETREQLYTPEFLESLRGFTPMEAVAPYYVGSDAPDALGRAQCADIQFYMTDDVLVKMDRMSMAHSLEVRAPLLDHRILEFAAQLPSRLKMSGRQGKLPLRRLASVRLPQDIRNLPKRGFSIPAAKWLREELRPMVEQALFGDRLPHEALEAPRLRALWREHLSGTRDHSVLLWGLMMLTLWQRTSEVEVFSKPQAPVVVRCLG